MRLKIGDSVYEQRLVALEDPEDIGAAQDAFAAKYGPPDAPPESRPPVRYFEVVARR